MTGECRLEKKDDGTIDFYYRGNDGQVKSMNCGLVLFGTGRKPIVQDMGLEVSAIGFCSTPMSCELHLCTFLQDKQSKTQIDWPMQCGKEVFVQSLLLAAYSTRVLVVLMHA